MAEPLPIRLAIPGSDDVGFQGVESVSYKVYGLLHVTEGGIALEWSGTKTTEQVTFLNVGTEIDEIPLDWLEVPAGELMGVRLVGGWWRPAVELRARYMDAFERVPSVQGVLLRLRIARRDRALAREVVMEIEEMIADRQLARQDRALLEGSRSDWDALESGESR